MASHSHPHPHAGETHGSHPGSHQHDLRPFRHSHAFGSEGEAARSRALLAVTLITIVTMVAELAAGWWSGSLALTADGWHMGTHAAALGGAVLAMRWSRRAREHEGFAFGGWKIEVLAAYTSALLLAAVAIGLAIDAVHVLVQPRPIAFGEAMVVAVLGLVVNLASVWLLSRSGKAEPAGHDHGHAHESAHPGHDHHGHGHGHSHHHDHNFRAAYMHVLADAFTSVLAIVALGAGLWWGWHWLDPVVALVGAAVIGQWSWGLLRTTARALVDASADAPLRDAVRAAIESDGDAKLADLHVWQVGAQAYSGVLSIVADRPLPADAYQQRLQPITQLKHTTIEVHRCPNA
ncbi:CDF family Co(II)/Ni(II) efflux transporter DmeF [Aquabacterium sp.]|uniref:CDF family Co(II)/Ni(II) efflux transporter DmeF n=1 Tax=Aquabacterium sp. TaxID=1872578 RepID=UPI002BF0AA71|nr:CDF family Co(II)/Ni(II) efflux transporter DmeF [Aquabacterium sp.]HSW03049.1 CDF family Co(II)/Ni(II) efflux transporter DmeF [Aquabacterium sp.]